MAHIISQTKKSDMKNKKNNLNKVFSRSSIKEVI